MTDANPSTAADTWLVNVKAGDGTDNLERFVREGLWEGPDNERSVARVKAVQVGDLIVAKTTSNRKSDLPFDNKNHSVAVMLIRAHGVVEANDGDGRQLKVRWLEPTINREWYFYTYIDSVVRIIPDNSHAQALLSFIFENISQDISYFRNAPFWRRKFGDDEYAEINERVAFYEEIANALLPYREDRSSLIQGLHEIDNRLSVSLNLQDKFGDGTVGPLRDICPFTVMGLFNRGTSDENRRLIANEIAEFLNVTHPVPISYTGVPIFNPMASWLFNFEVDRAPGEIDSLWDLFEAALSLGDEPVGGELESEIDSAEAEFVRSFDSVHVKPAQLGKVLHWVRPWIFVSLDAKTQSYLDNVLKFVVGDFGVGTPSFGGEQYLELDVQLLEGLANGKWEVGTLPDLTYRALTIDNIDSDSASDKSDAPPIPDVYTVADVVNEGSFVSATELQAMVDKLRSKKNIILQGAPGTGKTWLAKRIGYVLLEVKDRKRLRALQFHPNMSYEDFVRGWRPSGDGKLSLVDGVFLETVAEALEKPDSDHIIVIEEINRGNLAQIFGEMLTLLEADKRKEDEALRLGYQVPGEPLTYIPSNLYVIGTMNVADRSLAIVDVALRRRFAFFSLEPKMNDAWFSWVTAPNLLSPSFAKLIRDRINSLNVVIADDRNLGLQYRIGHSFVTPSEGAVRGDEREWFSQVVEHEIGPLLDEYWFDSPEIATAERAKLKGV